MPKIELHNIRNKYILKEINLEVHDGELLIILGPSGAGKTTLLNVIAGLEVYEGSIFFDGLSIDNLSPQKRRVGFVFQENTLFPHMKVQENIAYGLKVQKKNEKEIKERVDELLRLMKIEHLCDRYPRTLSGGEKQRVAIARALATNPAVLLMDEPFNNLDIRLRKYLWDEFKRIQKKLGVTTIFVTHDLKEAEELGDRIAIMHNGLIKQIGTLEEIMSSPADSIVFDFIGRPNIFKCASFEVIDFGLAKVKCANSNLSMIVPYDGKKIHKVIVFPEDVYIYPSIPKGPMVNVYEGIIKDIRRQSQSKISVKIDVQGCEIRAELLKDSYIDHIFKKGSSIFVKLKLKDIMILTSS